MADTIAFVLRTPELFEVINRYSPGKPRALIAPLKAWERSRHMDHVTFLRNLEATSEGTPYLRLLWRFDSSQFTSTLMDAAARIGAAEALRFFHEMGITCTVEAMNSAACWGHLDVIKFLTQHDSAGCTTDAMDYASLWGRLEIVEYLHKHRSEGCTTRALDWAAGRNHFSVVQFLHENRAEGCTYRAMNIAAANGHLEMVRWLHENRSEGCTAEAIDRAALGGHMDVVKFLTENRSEGFTRYAIPQAESAGFTEIVEYLKAVNAAKEAKAAAIA
ncbi:hypothetical protein ACHHYP_04655 [Achlya hypogyna]|uniref:Ankyrin repeat protein n=1 Tax=Achlya hypogyna TaxID=1202772 RepID=A0A1V9Z0F3_ACHHY|nr:hypothetical protein ACHHYP_04655 [Achlya hypogyna]